MIHGMSRDAWNEFSKTILVRYVLSYLCGTLYLDSSASLQRMFAFPAGSLFSLLTHALTCLRSGQAPQESAPPKKIRMLATYMWRMSNNLEIRIAGSSCRPQLYFV